MLELGIEHDLSLLHIDSSSSIDSPSSPTLCPSHLGPFSPLDHSLFPLIFDRILQLGDSATLSALRPTSREIRGRVDGSLWRHLIVDSENDASWYFDPSPAHTTLRIPSHPNDLAFNLNTLRLVDHSNLNSGLNVAECLSQTQILDCIFPLPDSPSFQSLLMSLKPELVRVRCDWGKNMTLNPGFLSANTAVYFTNNAVHNYGQVGQHVTILTPVQAKRHVLNWWYAKRSTHTRSALNILDASSETKEFVLILHGDNRRHCAQIGSKISRGLMVIVDAVVRRPHIGFTLVGLERWCGYHSPAREFLERLVGLRHSPFGSSISPNVEFLSLLQYHDRVGSAQFHLETVLPTLKENKSFPR